MDPKNPLPCGCSVWGSPTMLSSHMTYNRLHVHHCELHSSVESSTYIGRVYTENTGGGCMADVIVLKSGRVVVITDDSVSAYPSQEAWAESGDGEIGTIDLFPPQEADNA